MKLDLKKLKINQFTIKKFLENKKMKIFKIQINRMNRFKAKKLKI